jgi:hypothetical protein
VDCSGGDFHARVRHNHLPWPFTALLFLNRSKAVAGRLGRRGEDRHSEFVQVGCRCHLPHGSRKDKRDRPQSKPAAGFTAFWIARRVETQPAFGRRPTKIALLLPDDDDGMDKQSVQANREQHDPGDICSERIRLDIGRQGGEYDPAWNSHRDGSQGPDGQDFDSGGIENQYLGPVKV